MSSYEILLLTAGIIVGVIGTIVIAVPYLRKKGINAPKILNEVHEGLEEAGDVIKAAKELAPSKALDILQLIDNLTLRATEAVQQLAISGQLPLDQRKTTAKASILAGLKTFNISVTPGLEKVIDDAIERFVLDSKTDEEKKGQEENTLQKQINQLQQDKTELQESIVNAQQEAAELKQKITAVQDTIK